MIATNPSRWSGQAHTRLQRSTWGEIQRPVIDDDSVSGWPTSVAVGHLPALARPRDEAWAGGCRVGASGSREQSLLAAAEYQRTVMLRVASADRFQEVRPKVVAVERSCEQVSLALDVQSSARRCTSCSMSSIPSATVLIPRAAPSWIKL